jgi:hypothetical protein
LACDLNGNLLTLHYVIDQLLFRETISFSSEKNGFPLCSIRPNCPTSADEEASAEIAKV